MKKSTLQQKLIATALGLALTGIAGGAYAKVDLSTTGNGGLFFTLWDNNGTDAFSDDRAYFRDLSMGALANGTNGVVGSRLNDWAGVITNPKPSLTADKQTAGGPIFTVAPDANMQTFLAATTDMSRLRWNIAAVDSVGSDRVLVTSPGIEVDPSNPLFWYNSFRSVAGLGVDQYIGVFFNPSIGSNESALTFGDDAAVKFWDDKLGGRVPYSTSTGIGQSQGFWITSEHISAGNSGTSITAQEYMVAPGQPMQWKLENNGTLGFQAAAPIPEPESWAMLAAGLMLIGRIASRRRHSGNA